MKTIASLTAQSLAVLTAGSLLIGHFRAPAQTSGLDSSLPAYAVPLSLVSPPPANLGALYWLSSYPSLPPDPPPVGYGPRIPGQTGPRPLVWSGVPTNGAAFYCPSLGAILIDDRAAVAARMLAQADTGIPPLPGGDDGSGTNSGGGSGGTVNGGPWPYGTNDGLWILPRSCDGHLFTGALMNTVATNYLVVSVNPLSSSGADYLIEGTAPGSPPSVPFTLGVVRHTNQLYIRAEMIDDETCAENLPLSWQLYWFGDLTGLDPASPASPANHTLLDCYQNDWDPNIIQFSLLSASNTYTSGAGLAVSVNIQGGIPAFMAVLPVNDTNTADASWQPFTPAMTNLWVSTPTDGVYAITVAMAGIATNASQTWHTLSGLVRDSTPVTLRLTNLASFTGSRPFIDPAGYANRALSAITWTVVDANGLTNSGNGTVVAQGWNLSDPFHVTNWFQCLDLALALGTNQVSIQAVDWAGNMARTNFSYVFDTTGDTTAPSLALIWPQDGTQVSGDTLTIQARTDDDTAAVTLQYTDSNGTLHTADGLVERGGNVWVQGVPLAAGTNSFSLTATDAAGNVSTDNFSVIQSSVALMVTPLSQDQMKYGYARVVVTVGDPDCPAVTVNGQPATNDGGGQWEVDNVPLPPGGAVALHSTAQLSGGGTLETLLEQEREPIVFTQTYGYKLDYSWAADQSSVSETHHIELQWARGAGGTNLEVGVSVNDSGHVSSNVTATVWPADSGYWPRLPGQQMTSSYYDGELMDSSTTGVGAPAVEWMERSAAAGADSGVTYSESSQRELRMFTGDSAARQSQGLLDVSAALNLESYLDPNAPGWAYLYQGFTPFLQPATPPVPEPSQAITLGALGSLGSDGNLYTVQSSGTEVVITLNAPGPSYEGQLPLAQKYNLHTTANNIDLRTNTPEFCVGQYLTFAAAWDQSPEYGGSPLGVVSNSYDWVISSKYVNHPWQQYLLEDGVRSYYGSTNYDIDPSLLKNPAPFVWYVSSGPKNAVLSLNLAFSNGQAAKLAASGKFTVFRPSVVMVNRALHGMPTNVWQTPWNSFNFGKVGVGQLSGANDMAYLVRVVSADFAGSAKIVQICTINAAAPVDINVVNELDNSDPYTAQGYRAETHVGKFLDPTGYMNTVTLEDGPSDGWFGSLHMNASFVDYIMFTPGGPSDIYVPLGKITWSTSFAASSPSLTISPNQVIGPANPDQSYDWPVWTYVWSNPE